MDRQANKQVYNKQVYKLIFVWWVVYGCWGTQPSEQARAMSVVSLTAWCLEDPYFRKITEECVWLEALRKLR